MRCARVRAAPPCNFTLLVPRPYWDPETEEAAGGHVEGTIGDSDPFAAVEHAGERGEFDEIIVSTLPARVSNWHRRDLPHRVETLGLPVTVVTAKQSERARS
jgi:hypothetical protein